MTGHRDGPVQIPDTAGFSWQSHPLADGSRFRSLMLTGTLIGLSILVWISFGHVGYGFLSLAVLAGSLSRYFVPTRYKFDKQGVETSHLGSRRRLSWDEVRRVRIVEDGVFLSPFKTPSRLDAFRGTFLRFRQNRNEVVQLVREHCPHGSD